MEPRPNLFHTLGEWWDHRQAERRARATAGPGQPAPRLSRWLPTPGNVLFTLLLVGLLVLAQTVGALPSARQQGMAPDAPSTGTIAYQGRLADANGNPLTNTVPMIFRLYDAASGGAPLWEEQWTGSSSVQVSDGLFNVMLGSLAPIPASLITSHSSLFLGITVGTDDEMAPRVQLGSVPFAVQALTVPDGSVTSGKLADGAVTQAKLGSDVSLTPPDGSITTAKLADAAVTPGKASGFLITNGQNLLVQYANRSRVTGSSTTITFPEPFASTPTVVATADTVGGQTLTVSYISPTQFTVDVAPNTGGNIGINWIAIGESD